MPFKYSYLERIFMAAITGSSHITIIPTIILMKYQKKTYGYYLGIFALMNSILYHICGSLKVKIFLSPHKWHELDNIGVICCLNGFILSLSKLNNNLDIQNKLNYLSLFLVLIYQKRDPWNIYNAVMPIVIFTVVLIIQLIYYGIPKYYLEPFQKGFFFLILAIAMFFKGLDDKNDYLRIYHSFWHVLIGISLFYLLQIQNIKIVGIKDILKF
jgi:hypothetical protein